MFFFFFFGYVRENRTVFMMIETNKKMIKEIIHIPLFHSRLLDLASNWVIEFNILNLLFKGCFQ